MSTTFQRNIEDFTCEKCGAHVKGNGYTNHCPVCLWSKHVDINPGDRAADCGGLMEPIEIRTEGDEHLVVHRCTLCGHTKNNHLTENDNMDAAIAIAKARAESPQGTL